MSPARVPEQCFFDDRFVGDPLLRISKLLCGDKLPEKLHEVLIAPDEVNKTHDLGWGYAVYPSLKYFDMDNRLNNPVGERFSYASNDPDKMWSVSEEDMKDLSQLIERG